MQILQEMYGLLGTPGGGYWKWAWASSSLVEKFANKSRVMRTLAPLSGLEFFDLEAFEADENMAWEIAGMALKETGGIGIYRCPSKSSDLFVVIERVASNRHRS